MTRYLGGLITKDESLVIPSDSYENTSAPGVWTLEEAQMLSKQGLWPTAGNAFPQRGVFAGGRTSSSYSNFISYITIASTGNATEFGDLLANNRWMAGCASSTRGIFGGGYTSSSQDVIQYVTIMTTGNATDFGDLTVARYLLGGLSNSTRGVFAGGGGYLNVIDYITIASTGNATDFGDLTAASEKVKGCASTTRGLISGGEAGGAYTVTIEYITIASTGDASDFGDLIGDYGEAQALSNSHGGLS